ncbi:hypothetical protein [uncultured Tateyamaria sp.]|uniref:hypothetical protein n=1 Tax=Tateyamaria sp. 1078 TaxID=3417464 RepID=UPI0026293A0D|nr:hypothetical protein [uncultured Tateyamaria sp.]
MTQNTITLADPHARDRKVQEVVLRLVEAFAFREARAVLDARLKQIAAAKDTHIERLFLEWREQPPETRGDFLTYAHHRREPLLASPGD